MRKSIIFSVFTLISTLCVAQHFGFKFQGELKKVVIPVDVLNNLMVVPVVLNDEISLKFILDTGVRTTVLTQKTYSDILKLTYSKEIFVSGPGGKQAAAYVTDNVSLDLPGVHGSGHSMLVLEEDYLELRNYLGAEVHGILGYELFSRFIVHMDYERKRLVLYDPKHFRKKRRYQTLDISVEDTKPFVTADVTMAGGSEINAKLLIDTGASHGLMLQPNSDASIVVPERHINSVIGRSLGGIITGKIGRINSLQLGNYTINNSIANFPDSKSDQDTLIRSNNQARNGAIGGEVLGRFNIIFNFSSEEIYIKKNGSFKSPSNYDMSGITLKAKGAQLRTYEISELRKGSPAEQSGLLVGDIIVAINGFALKKIDLNQANGFFNKKEGKKLSLLIERKGKRSKIQFRLVNQI
jgi:hypothetical protein